MITNPPFFQNQLKSEDPKINQARHSTDLALSELLAIVSKLLKSNGIASILLPLVETRYMINQSSSWSLHAIKQLIIHDQPHKPPKAIVTYLSKIPEKTVRQILSIKNSQNNWSSEYKSLLRPYYLNI
jgi:tRNA1Val (adenine37-N6)-methyltransferase